MDTGTDNYEELKKFFEELFKDENILEAMRNTTIVPEHPPEWLNTFAEFNPPQISEDEMKAALVRMSVMDCSDPDRMGRIYSKEAITKAWKDWFNEFGGDSNANKGNN